MWSNCQQLHGASYIGKSTELLTFDISIIKKKVEAQEYNFVYVFVYLSETTIHHWQFFMVGVEVIG